jgi:16S rRNA (uracil1498-N3)-methyltransferase
MSLTIRRDYLFLSITFMLPFFYISAFNKDAQEITLDEDTSKHIIQVLRMAPGQALQLTDGKGALLTAVIIDDHKKKCRVRIQSTLTRPPAERKVVIAISLLKNASRFEWFLEKATEIGVSCIIPLLCERTEKQHARTDRLRNILVSAMLQSQQTWLPELPDPMSFTELLANPPGELRFIAHCLEAPRPTISLADWRHQEPAAGQVSPKAEPAPRAAAVHAPSPLILIGPEGDFSPTEIELALKEGFLPVTLGDNRLRTETAGVAAATLLCVG